MSLITKEHSSLVLQSLKKLLSFKADKEEVQPVLDSFSILTDDYALELSIENEFIEPLCAVDGTIYTAANGDVYVL